MMMLVIIAGTAFTFSSCRDDSEDNGNSIVGTWTDGEEFIMFCKDGTCFGFEPHKDRLEINKATYKYIESSNELTLYALDGYKETWEVLSLTSERMRLMEEDGKIWLFERVKDPYTEEELEKIYQAQKDRS